jgi:DNA invertase Pin-like site-specific DNA recombinase
MVQTKRAAIYCRVSTDDQSCERQLNDLHAFAERAGYNVTAVFQEKASGVKTDRVERAKLLKLAQARKIDLVLVTELTRWGRSTVDLLDTLQDLNAQGVSVIAQTGSQFDLDTAQGKMIAGMLSVLAAFERDLISERTKSGLASARAKGKKLGRQKGQNPSDKYAKAVLKHVADGRTYRWISHEMQINKTTVTAIVRRHSSTYSDAVLQVL